MTGIVSLLLCAGLLLLGAATAEAEAALDPERIEAIATLLPTQPEGLGRPIKDRAAWSALAAKPGFAGVVAEAEKLLAQPLPEQPDELFLQFSTTGNRTNWQRVAGQRRGRVTTLVLAECVENQGRFLPAFESLVTALCAEPTWVMPAHDAKLTNFHGETIDIDLASAALAWNLATADRLLADRLAPATRTLLRENLARRVLQPYRDMVEGRRGPNWWLLTTNNWNAVCLAGVTGTALAELESVEDRALFVAAAEVYSDNFLRGFTPDGYCSEGLGYWNYGFGHYLMLAETIWQATGGGIDLFEREGVAAPAAFPLGIEIQHGVSPAFADCSVTARPTAWTVAFLNRRFGLGLTDPVEFDRGAAQDTLFGSMIYSFPNSASEPKAAGAAPERLRTWFADAGILIARPAPRSETRLGVALKGGHNAEHHNHNDVGSYVAVVDARPVLLDPGSETYTARTFSSRRYESKVLNSWGHPVPLVGGQLQRTGKAARGEVLASEFTGARDTLKLDLRSAYDVPALDQLERTFVYDRAGAGSLTITDEAKFSQPTAFGTALITRGQWQRQDDGTLLIYDFDEAVEVELRVTGGEVAVTSELIEEEVPVLPTRLGIDFTAPVTAATITAIVRPAELAGDTLLKNGGFELKQYGWQIPNDGLAAISDERASDGQFSLKITDTSSKGGTNIHSAAIPLTAGQDYELRGKIHLAEGQGVGLYLKFTDAAGKMVNAVDDQGNLPPLGTPDGKLGEWVEFALPFTPPAATVSARIWIHSFNAAQVTAYLDELSVTPR